MNSPINVVLVDDHMVVRQGIRSLLANECGIAVVGEAGDCQTALEVVKITKPDVVLLDLQIPGANGSDLCWQLGQVSAQSNILILTAFLNPHLLKSCLSSGARGYLMKDTENLDIVSAVKVVACGGTMFDSRVAGLEKEIFQGESRALFENLTPKEMQVISLLCLGFTNNEISNELSISINTVKSHVKTIMRKFDCRNRTEIANRARELHLV